MIFRLNMFDWLIIITVENRCAASYFLWKPRCIFKDSLMKVHENSNYLKWKSLAMLHMKTDQRQLHKDKIHERAAIAESLNHRHQT